MVSTNQFERFTQKIQYLQVSTCVVAVINIIQEKSTNFILANSSVLNGFDLPNTVFSCSKVVSTFDKLSSVKGNKESVKIKLGV